MLYIHLYTHIQCKFSIWYKVPPWCKSFSSITFFHCYLHTTLQPAVAWVEYLHQLKQTTMRMSACPWWTQDFDSVHTRNEQINFTKPSSGCIISSHSCLHMTDCNTFCSVEQKKVRFWSSLATLHVSTSIVSLNEVPVKTKHLQTASWSVKFHVFCKIFVF